MRLLYADPHPVPDLCTESLQILYTADALGQTGAEVVLVTPPPKPSLAPQDILGRPLSPQVRLVPLEAGLLKWLPLRTNRFFYRAVARYIARTRPDLVYARHLKLAESVLDSLPDIPLVFETHEHFAATYREDHPRPGWRERHKLAVLEQREAYVYRHAHGIVSLTEMLLEDIRAAYGVGTPAVVAPDGVDLQQARSQTAPARADHKPCLLYLGSLHPWKGVDTLIRAMPFVAAPAELHIAGGNDRRIAALRRLAEELGVADRVVFHGPVEPARRFEYIHRADVCLLPLTATSIGARHTSPIKLFEYMAAGKPIVAADLPSIRAVVTPGVHALTVAVGDPRAFAAAIDRLLADPAESARLAAAARTRAADFTWENRGRTIAAFLERIAEQSRTTRCS
jgi:glycosyltransferase involved in cell wall biosynthesis